MKSVALRFLMMPALVAIGLAGCGGPAEEAADTQAPAATPAPQDAAPAPAVAPQAAAPTAPPASNASGSSGSIVGKAVFEGPAPARKTLETEGDPKCHAMHAEAPLLSDREVVAADGGVQWAFAYIKNPPAGTYPAPEGAAELDQIGCAYTPHVIGVRVGQKLNIKNTDPTLHNVRGIARNNKPFNFGQPEASPPRERVFDKAEMEIRVKCDIHSWMTGFIFAMDHPFFAVSDGTGAFTINSLPAGDYTLVVWHEAYGTQEVPVTVTAGAAANASVTFKAAA